MEKDQNDPIPKSTAETLADHLRRRKEIWEAKREAENSGGKTVSTGNIGYGNPPKQEKGFAAETADQTGVTKQAINKAISRAEKIPEPEVLSVLSVCHPGLFSFFLAPNS